MFTKQWFTRWLHALLVVSMLGSLLLPVPIAMAVKATGNLNQHSLLTEAAHSPSLPYHNLITPVATDVSEIAHIKPKLQGGGSGQWIYPIGVVNTGSTNIVGSSMLFESITPQNVLGPEDNLGGGARITFTCPGPPCSAGDFIQGIYDLGAVIRLNSGTTIGGINVEGQTHSLSLASGGFNFMFPEIRVSLYPTGPWTNLLTWPGTMSASFRLASSR
jgi:hypothetical protein